MDSTVNALVAQAAGASRPTLSSALAQAGSDVDRAAEDFEAVFLNAMLAPLFEGIETPEPFGGGSAEQTWRGLLVDEYAKTIASAGGVGIADSVRAELLRMQEALQ
ncbi:MAG: rod-binding protein [Hyphomicrobiaceae bacterium]|nr:rod-binding protein [Hyphomicrobiaceae bacterium]